MSTQFKPITLPPGVVAQATKKMSSVNYAEVNMVRWVEGQLSPIGGQSKYAFAFASRCKAVHGFYDLQQIYHTAYLCESNLYVDNGGSLIDITPNDGILPPTPPTEGGYGDLFYNTGPPDTYGTPRSIGADAAIDRVPDAYSLANFGAILLAMTSADGRLLYWDPAQPASVFNAPIYQPYGPGQLTINMNVVNPGSVLPGMAVFNQTTDEPVGVVATYAGALLTLTAATTTWSQSPSDILVFGANVAKEVAPKSGSTVPNGRCFVVTPERFVQVFGSYNDGTEGTNIGGSFRRFAWCDQEDYTSWNYEDVTSQAGFIDIEPSSPIITACATRNGTIFWTAKKAYVSRYLGVPYVYNYVELGDNCTPWSPQSVVTTSSMVLWFSQQGPYSFDGTSILPVQCMARAWIDDDIDLLNVREQACAVHVANFNEFWWFFPQGPQTNPGGYNTRAVIYNYKEGWWGQARCARSAGVTASYTSHTIMANGLVSYEHEYGNVYWDCDLPWVETFDLNALSTSSAAAFQGQSGGAKLMTIKQMIPDVDGAASNLLYSLFYRNSRSVGLPELQTTPSPVRSDGYVDMRTTGRDIRLRIDLAIPAGQIVNGVASDGSVLPVTLGQHLIDVVLRGDR